MLKSTNFTVLECTQCGERIKIEPNVPFDTNIHKCATKPLVTKKPQEAPTKEAPKEEKKKNSFIGK